MIIPERLARLEIDIEKLRSMFEYQDGQLIRRTDVHYNAKAGDVAGTVDPTNGYLKVNFDGKVRFVHRLIWALVHGEQPPPRIDHWDTIRANNRIGNLRACTAAQNQMNRTPRAQFKGVTFHKGAAKFAAQIVVNKRPIYLGLFDTADCAARAYDSACLHHFGEFARPNFQGAAL